jgi:hypothetical protein
MRWARHVAWKGEIRGSYRFSVGRPEGKSQFGRRRGRCIDNIKMDLQEIAWEGSLD